jgi:small-conductance mechanosensitive channel
MLLKIAITLFLIFWAAHSFDNYKKSIPYSNYETSKTYLVVAWVGLVSLLGGLVSLLVSIWLTQNI